jgi:hypothetical protein
MPAPKRAYWTVVVTSQMEDGMAIISTHGHFRDIERAEELRKRLMVTIDGYPDLRGNASADLCRIDPPTISAMLRAHEPRDET